MTISIRPIQEEEKDAVWQMFQDIPAKENNTENHAHGMNHDEFDEFCKKNVLYTRKENLPEGRIPQIIYIISDDDVPVGFGKFRPFLNEECIKKKISQFAYMISPKYRNKGYATHFLSFLKEEASVWGLKEIMAGVLKENKVSRHIIEKSGGILKECTEERAIYTIALQDKSR